MIGKFVHIEHAHHRCPLYEGVFVPDQHGVGTIWECDCGQRWKIVAWEPDHSIYTNEVIRRPRLVKVFPDTLSLEGKRPNGGYQEDEFGNVFRINEFGERISNQHDSPEG